MQNQPTAHDARKSGKVLPFRRPGQPPPLVIVNPAAPPRRQSADDGLARYEAEREEPINDRQRMLMNLIAVGIVVLLISVGVWIADAIQVSIEKQDCALQGRTNCAPIELPARR